jgi:hypothetical protein
LNAAKRRQEAPYLLVPGERIELPTNGLQTIRTRLPAGNRIKPGDSASRVAISWFWEISAMPLTAWWGPTGLVLDLIGVLLLGFDLIRVQRMLRSQAAEDLANFERMAEAYGGTESWI